MLKIAFVEDSPEERERVGKYCEQFQKEEKVEISLSYYPNGLRFLSDYHEDVQLVLMDIDMPILNGMDAAKSLREMDDSVALVFYTNLGKLAVKGYEVNALDFLVKPVSYATFKAKLKKWMPKIDQTKKQLFVLQLSGGGLVKLSLSDIYYIESCKHYLIYHAVSGQYQTRGTMREAEKDLANHGFSRTIGGMLVNLEFIKKVDKDTVTIGRENEDIVLPLARTRKKEFMDDFMEFLKHGG